MRKLLIFLFLLVPVKINALEDDCTPYLKSLEITDYKYTPFFHLYTNTYSVNIPSDVFKLDILYERDSVLSEVNVYNNDSLDDLSEIIIEVKCPYEKEEYKIIINKDEEQSVFYHQEEQNPFTLKIQIITIISLSLGVLSILFLLSRILFFKRKV